MTFTGRINARLHAKTVERLAREIDDLKKSIGEPLLAETAELNQLLNLFQPAYRFLKDKPELWQLQQKWGCPEIKPANLLGGWTGELPYCGTNAIRPFLREAIKAWAGEAVWPIGTPVSVQWTIHVNGQSFSLTHTSSEAWTGVQLEEILNMLYE